MSWDDWKQTVELHRFKITGGLLGFLFALMVWRFGFLWTVFIAACTGFGYWVGKRLDEEPESLAEALERLIPPAGR